MIFYDKFLISVYIILNTQRLFVQGIGKTQMYLKREHIFIVIYYKLYNINVFYIIYYKKYI